MTKILDTKNNYKKSMLLKASLLIKNGKLVLFPTETVYGIGADGLNEKAVNKIFIAKNRKSDNPLILHVSSIEMIKRIAIITNPLEMKIIETFFPGPITIILKKKKIVPSIVSANLDTVGIRMPESIIAHDLIELSNTPIAAPSANISGKPSGTNIKDIFDELNNKVDYIIDNGQTKIGVESTVVKVINNEIHILRPGKITKNDLKVITDKIIIDSHVLSSVNTNDLVLSPGMKYKHYAPNSNCILVYSKNNNLLINKINELLEKQQNYLVVCKTHNKELFKNSIDMGETKEEISKNIFTILRKVDSYNADIVIIEGVDTDGLGLAIMNRLIRACSYNYIEIK